MPVQTKGFAVRVWATIRHNYAKFSILIFAACFCVRTVYFDWFENREINLPGPRQLRSQGRVLFRVRETWTHDFFCLSSTAVTCVPSRSEKISLQKAKEGFFFRVRETWTHDFFCLSSTAVTCVPSRSEKISLQNAGLGRRKVVFSCRASALDIKENLESVFPKLKESRGFEILRSTQGTLLSLIMGLNGATANYACVWCKIHKNGRWNLREVKEM